MENFFLTSNNHARVDLRRNRIVKWELGSDVGCSRCLPGARARPCADGEDRHPAESDPRLALQEQVPQDEDVHRRHTGRMARVPRKASLLGGTFRCQRVDCAASSLYGAQITLMTSQGQTTPNTPKIWAPAKISLIAGSVLNCFDR